MKKIFYVLFCFLLSNTSHASCDMLFSNLSDTLKQDIPVLTWVDINPAQRNTQCLFVIRYFPCDTSIQNQIDQTLPGAIKQAANCAYRSKGEHSHTEGYCTLDNVIADC